MKLSRVVLMAGLALAGCNKPRGADGDSADARGRYSGIGTYSVGRMWSQLTAPKSTSEGAAKLSDDQQIIVVVDSHTGEVRQCGNISGYCISMNPWSGSLPAAQAAPVMVAKHADQLDAEAAARTKSAAVPPAS
jgi:hypothetical protein